MKPTMAMVAALAISLPASGVAATVFTFQGTVCQYQIYTTEPDGTSSTQYVTNGDLVGDTYVATFSADGSGTINIGDGAAVFSGVSGSADWSSGYTEEFDGGSGGFQGVAFSVSRGGGWLETSYASADGSGEATDYLLIGLPNVSAVPEPASWAMMIVGFGLMGAMVRRKGERHA